MKCIAWFEDISGTTRVFIFTLCCTGAFAPATWAQTHRPDSSTKGFSVGGHVAVIGANADPFDRNGQRTDAAGVTITGYGFVVAYGVNEWFTVALNGDGSESKGDRHLSFADIGAQFFLPLPSGNRLLPHLDIAQTGRRAEFGTANGAIDTRGAGFSVGGGVFYFVSRSLALDTTLLWTGGGLHQHVDGKRVKGLDAIGVSGTRLLIGVRWYPGR